MTDSQFERLLNAVELIAKSNTVMAENQIRLAEQMERMNEPDVALDPTPRDWTKITLNGKPYDGSVKVNGGEG